MTTTDDLEPRPLRADAERNRRRILAAASRVFAERGLGASLDEVAVAAEVGVGTVYRRFGDKDGLIEALVEDKIGAVVDLAHACLEDPDPWEGFARFFRGMCAINAQDRGLKEILFSSASGGEMARRGRDSIAPVAIQLLRRAQEAGAVRPDLAGSDMPLLHFAVGHAADRTRDVAPEVWERMATVILDGLRVRRDAPTPMVADPLALADIPRALGADPRRRG